MKMEHLKINKRHKTKLFWNKKGDEKILSIWWFIMWIIVGVGIAAGVIIFNSAEIDVRGYESSYLYTGIMDCANHNGYLNPDFLAEDFNIFKNCSLNEKVFGVGSNFYFYYDIKDENGNSLAFVSRGKESFKSDCVALKEKNPKQAVNYPICFQSEEKILFYDRQTGMIKKYSIEVLTASNQEGKRFVNEA